jgi:hypothetical protein
MAEDEKIREDEREKIRQEEREKRRIQEEEETKAAVDRKKLEEVNIAGASIFLTVIRILRR